MVTEILIAIINGAGLTILLTATSLVVGGVLAVPLVIARNSRFALLRLITSAYISGVRSVPPLTWLFLIFFGLPQFALRLDPLEAAIIGFSVIASAFMAEIYRSGLLSIPAGQREAAIALGMSPWTAGRYIISPQAYRVALTPIATYAIALLKDSALASAIGVQEMTFYAQQSASQFHQGILSFTIAGVLYVLISLVIATFSRRVDRAMRQKVGVSQ